MKFFLLRFDFISKLNNSFFVFVGEEVAVVRFLDASLVQRQHDIAIVFDAKHVPEVTERNVHNRLLCKFFMLIKEKPIFKLELFSSQFLYSDFLCFFSFSLFFLFIGS